MNTFIIFEKLPGLNEYTKACRTNKYVGAKFKKDIEELIGTYILKAKSNKTLWPVKGKTKIRFIYHEKTKRRDADNIASCKKFILDALVKYGILPDDSQQYVVGFEDKIIADTHDYVDVTIFEEELNERF